MLACHTLPRQLAGALAFSAPASRETRADSDEEVFGELERLDPNKRHWCGSELSPRRGRRRAIKHVSNARIDSFQIGDSGESFQRRRKVKIPFARLKAIFKMCEWW